MGERIGLTDEEWALIGPLRPAERGRGCRLAQDNRRFFEGMMWLARTGARWRHLPEDYGKWNSVFRRDRRWLDMSASSTPCWRAWRRLSSEIPPPTCFVWSNTQNNLSTIAQECDGLDLVLTPTVVERIINAGDELSQKPARYVFVTYANRHTLAGFAHPRASFHVIRKDASSWAGDTDQWSEIFKTLKDHSWKPALSAVTE